MVAHGASRGGSALGCISPEGDTSKEVEGFIEAGRVREVFGTHQLEIDCPEDGAFRRLHAP